MNEFINILNTAKDAVVNARKYAQDQNLVHTQEYINFEDFINRISTMEPDEQI